MYGGGAFSTKVKFRNEIWLRREERNGENILGTRILLLRFMGFTISEQK